jgi:hypothetical protein
MYFTMINNNSFCNTDIRVSDCYLMPTQQFFNYIMAKTSYIRWDDDDIFFVLDQQA